MSGEKPVSNRVITVAMSPSILQPLPALRPIVSASLCPPGGEEVGGGAVTRRARPLPFALSNHSAAPPGAAAARCLRTDYAAFRCSRKYSKQLQGSLLLLRVQLNLY